MTTTEFIESYKTNKDLIKHINAKYVPYLEKVTRCEKLINITCYDDNNNFYRKSAMQALLFTLMLIDIYTDIDIDFSNPANEYDTLEKDGHIEKIMQCIPKSEESQFRAILSMTQDDFIANERNITSFIEHKAETLVQLLNK